MKQTAQPAPHAPAPVNGNHRQLSTREREIVELASRGHTDKEIADQLGIGVASVNTYWRRVFKKVKAQSRVAAFARIRAPDRVT